MNKQGNSPETRHQTAKQFFHKLNQRKLYRLTDPRTGNELHQALVIVMWLICKTMAKFCSEITSKPRTRNDDAIFILTEIISSHVASLSLRIAHHAIKSFLDRSAHSKPKILNYGRLELHSKLARGQTGQNGRFQIRRTTCLSYNSFLIVEYLEQRNKNFIFDLIHITKTAKSFRSENISISTGFTQF